MKLQEIIERAQRDESFASRLKAQATRGGQAGVGTDAWEELMRNFAENPDELARLRVPGQEVKGAKIGKTTTTTSLTATTIACTTTTTTTTTTDWFKAAPQ
jgi:hypothetical protein